MKKKVIIGVSLFIVSALAVVLALFMTSETDNGAAIEKLDAMLASRDKASLVLSGDLDDLSKFDPETLKNYSESIRENKQNLDELLADKVCGNDKNKSHCDELSTSYSKLSESADVVDLIAEFVTQSQDVAGVSNDTLEKMKGSSNGFLQEFANDLLVYRAAVDSFSSSYVANADSSGFVNDYSSIEKQGREIKEKYSEIDSAKLLGSSAEDLLSFYDKAEEFKQLLSENKK